ncbi:MAG: hypothetical protein KA885_05835 [Spirochaetes bacterium]|nr:hypothetical protein [Spirochaetota bacterium]
MDKPDVKLIDGEQIVIQIEAELWAGSSNPMVRFLAGITKFVSKILGYRKKGFLIITNKRVIEYTEEIQCYCYVSSKETKIVIPSSVKEIGYSRAATFMGICCPAYFLYYDAHTQRTMVQLKGGSDFIAMDYVNKFYAAITSK